MRVKSVTLSKIEANRRNALKSTGPKDTSITRLNALKHGLLSKEILIAGEDDRELEELGKRLRMELAPQGELENIFVDRIVSSAWRLKRAIRVERDFIQAEYEDCKLDNFRGMKIQDSKAWNLVVTRELGTKSTWLNLIRYETTIEKQIYKALHELMRLQSARRGEKHPLPVAIDVDITTES